MDYTVLGEVPASAKRVQELAAPGQILLDDATAKQIKDRQSLRPLAPGAQSGKGVLSLVYELQSGTS